MPLGISEQAPLALAPSRRSRGGARHPAGLLEARAVILRRWLRRVWGRRRRARSRALLASLAATTLVTLGACAPRPPASVTGAPVDGWQAALGRDHPLTGRIWDVARMRFIEPRRLTRQLARARFVLLGEKHDNPDHHRLQAWLLRALIDAGRRPVVAFEMFETTDAPSIARYLAAAPKDAAGLGDAVGWRNSGWPPWDLYAPIAQTALDARLPIVAANVPAGTARALAREGLRGVSFDVAARLGIDAPLSPQARAAMMAEIREAHCGRIGEPALERMVLAQRARDAQMAASLAAEDRGDGGVLITGAGHARKDLGVPVELAERAPGTMVAAVAFLEVRDGLVDAAAYGERFGASLPFDHVWFTPRVDDGNPC